MPWLDDLVTLLTDVATLNSDLFTSTKGAPPQVTSGAVLQIIETSGAGVDYTNTTRTNDGTVQFVPSPAYERPSAAIISRGRTPEAARIKARAAFDAIVGVRNQFVNSGWYLWIKPVQLPYEVPVDDRAQGRYTFSVIALKRPS